MKDRRQDRFEEAFKSWARRSPQTPADEAARLVRDRLPERRARGWYSGNPQRLVTAAAGLALLLVVGWYTMPESSGPSSSQEEVALPPLSDDVVLLWLDDETPLYLTVAPPATKGGS